jgi:hypothetical protein
MRWPAGAAPGDGKSCLSAVGGASLFAGLKLRPSGGAAREPRLRVAELSVEEGPEEDDAVGAVSTAVTMVGSTWLDILDMLILLLIGRCLQGDVYVGDSV